MVVHCLFEQSGTFKNEFRKLGIEAYDYDISNQFNQTDYVVDLFEEIDKGFHYKQSIFNNINSDDLIFCFFPCTRFESQALLLYRCDNISLKHWGNISKTLYDIKLMDELHSNYNRIMKLVYICLANHLQLIIENPYSTQHFLLRYSFLKPTWIDYDRRLRGDYFKKPTMFFFINRDIHNNFVNEALSIKENNLQVERLHGINRSLISPDYANRFIKEFIL